jgi:hypothetical protein
MGMDAIIEGKDLRFSQLLAESTYKLYPEVRMYGDFHGYIDLTRDKILKIIDLMAEELETFSLRDSSGNIPLQNAQYMVSNTMKLYTLLEWTFKDEPILTFA